MVTDNTQTLKDVDTMCAHVEQLSPQVSIWAEVKKQIPYGIAPWAFQWYTSDQFTSIFTLGLIQLSLGRVFRHATYEVIAEMVEWEGRKTKHASTGVPNLHKSRQHRPFSLVSLATNSGNSKTRRNNHFYFSEEPGRTYTMTRGTHQLIVIQRRCHPFFFTGPQMLISVLGGRHPSKLLSK